MQNVTTLRIACFFALVIVLAAGIALVRPETTRVFGHETTAPVTLMRTPGGGLQPQAAVDSTGVLHLIYFTGEPGAGDVYYVRREPGKDSFSAPLRVNSQSGSVIATGNIRGAQLAIGKGGRVHVSWMGSQTAEPKGPGGAAPMLYARLNDAKTAFEAQRNVMQFAIGLDGGGSVASDSEGRVYVAWHGRGDKEGEASRRVWLARSKDEGRTFAREVPAYSEPTGACGCCGMRAFADSSSSLYMLYRAATNFTDRDMFLLSSADHGEHFRGQRLHAWKLETCPMSSTVMAETKGGVLAAWETAGQVYFTRVPSSNGIEPIAAPGDGKGRKHPAIAVNRAGDILLVWTEGMGWKRGGNLAWQIFDANGRPKGQSGAADGVPVWSLPTAIALPDGGFEIIY